MGKVNKFTSLKLNDKNFSDAIKEQSLNQHVRQRAHVSRALNSERAREKEKKIAQALTRAAKAYVVPVARPATVHAVLAALMTIDHLPLMIDRLVGRLGLHA